MKVPISVIIPCFRQEQWLDRAVESAQAQTDSVNIYPDGKDPFRAGVCYARNFLTIYARHDLIFPLDADDRLYPGALERLYAAWQPGTWVYGRYTEIDENEQVIREMDAPPPGMIGRKNLTYSSFLFHRDDWKRVGGYDPLFEFGDEDYAFQVALTDAGVRPVRLAGAPLYKRMIHERGSRTERAIRYFPMVRDLLKEKYPATMRD